MTPVAMPDPTRCACGRVLRLLNEHSDTPKCPACGLLPEWCRCAPAEDL